MDPRWLLGQPLTKLQRGLIEGLFRDGRPKLQLIAALAASVTVETRRLEVDRKASAGLVRWMQGTDTVELIAPAVDADKLQQIKHLAHRDFGTKSLEVKAGHKSFAPARGGITARVDQRRGHRYLQGESRRGVLLAVEWFY
jgi:hypothetical protein